ncbi:MAG: serine/threonine protein kinase [Thermoproteota archaeon]|nr:serine/threonine protein kinase [Thermoproteota archaeon]
MYQRNISFSDEVDIRSSRFLHLILYPRFSESEYEKRIAELKSLGITSIILDGRTIVNGIRVAGKGCVGLVVKAKSGSKVYALKIRRTDADRKTMDNEARLHIIANSAGVGPSLEGHTKNIIAMEFITGQNIIDWLDDNSEKARIRSVARAILEQCFSLDRASIDHGELSRLARHVIVSNRPYIVDFESASTIRKTCNVTAATQAIFLHGIIASKVKERLGKTNREKVIQALRRYKNSQKRENFEVLLDSLSI